MPFCICTKFRGDHAHELILKMVAALSLVTVGLCAIQKVGSCFVGCDGSGNCNPISFSMKDQVLNESGKKFWVSNPGNTKGRGMLLTRELRVDGAADQVEADGFTLEAASAID